MLMPPVSLQLTGAAPKVGDIVTGGDGKRWRVHCVKGPTLGLVPATWWGRMKWRLRLRSWRLM